MIEGQAAVCVDLKATMPPQFICQGTADQICDVHVEGKTYSDVNHGDRGSSGSVFGPETHHASTVVVFFLVFFILYYPGLT